jgi:hypothetical protein
LDVVVNAGAEVTHVGLNLSLFFFNAVNGVAEAGAAVPAQLPADVVQAFVQAGGE